MTARPEAAAAIALPWVIRLRYAMAGGQFLVAVLVDRGLHTALPLGWVALPPAIMALSNFWLTRRTRTPDTTLSVEPTSMVNWCFVLDTFCLTAVLMLTGGPNNPFTLLYLVQITLSATILTKRQTWALGGLATLCFGALFFHYRPIPVIEMHHHGQGGNLHLIGMWVGFAIATFFVALFSGKISELLRERESSLLDMQEQLARKDRLASLATLAAGAAHELSTPLGTIAVVAKDVERYAERTAHDASLAEDSRLIRSEVDRCHRILRRMSAEGAEPMGEALTMLSAHDVLRAVAREFPPDRVRQQTESGSGIALLAPPQAIHQALSALVRNALDASQTGTAVLLNAERAGDFVRLVVSDRGSGMPEETLRRVGEPFFTTKAPGQGMGLGVFLVRTLAEQLNGHLTFSSTRGAGTVATLEIPANQSHD
jgi:two-component system sensor histidine kinase RegB